MPRVPTQPPTVADPGLAPAGQARIEWADSQMPVLAAIRERFARERPLDGVRIAVCLHVTAETANLVRTLIAGGAQTGVCAANPFSTQDDVAAALVTHHGAAVHARRGDGGPAYAAHLARVLESTPDIAIDDGGDLIAAAHAGPSPAAETMLGATEETRTGLVRMRTMEAAGDLRCPVLAVNEALTERIFNDRYGTGQSTLDGILRATDILLAGRSFVVLGYGLAGRGVAQRAQGAGASVIVCEVDPIRALEARMDGFEVMPALAATERGEVFVTVTGAPDVLRREHFERMRDGAILANAGHFDVEISLPDLAAAATRPPVAVLPLVDQYDLGNGRRVNLLAKGRVVNLAAAAGHPAAVMDMSFAGQALAAEYLVRAGRGLGAGVHPVPMEIDREVARLKLGTLGIELDTLTEAQERYLRSFA
ncbi:MAG TPA: adenosylhomocysteinase [Solirubrobacteraceae bacterium]|jgi:adenosylhomocysteinase|nr:adenosylhomocysteinase [Solirubrobacteraceae bacterium]